LELGLHRKTLDGTTLPRLILAFLCIVPSAWSADPLARLVTIYRDNFGVPHIIGETEKAAFFGYGYAQAQDHLERMMLQYRCSGTPRGSPRQVSSW
jgi:acyl-homoserine lactone acylase PvdQ